MGKIKELRQAEDDMADQEAPNMGIQNFPTLYKKTNTGAIQFWTISVKESQEKFVKSGVGGETLEEKWVMCGVITTEYGQVGTDSPQSTEDFITNGKNAGKKNETSAVQQAINEAQAKWEKQKKKGYVETQEGAQNGELDELIVGGELPMLAESYMDVIQDYTRGNENKPSAYLKTKEAKNIRFPVFVQPKLDGIRCIAIVKNGEATLWSRTRKRINSCPHIVQELEAAFENMNIILDGELYNHEMKTDFEKIVSLVRQDKPGEGHEMVQYHVYDTISDGAFKNRYAQLHRLFRMFEFYSLQLVKTSVAKTEEEAMKQFEAEVKAGYEGAMLRNVNSDYVGRRSMDLQKIKPFIDAEFPIVGVKEGRGKLAGHAIFSCQARNGNLFDVKLKGETSNLKQYLEQESTWKNKELTVRYQGLTNKERVPRFPVGLAVRDYE